MEKNTKFAINSLRELVHFSYNFVNSTDTNTNTDLAWAESFSHLVYNFISVKYDLNIFYENPSLAIDLIKFKE